MGRAVGVIRVRGEQRTARKHGTVTGPAVKAGKTVAADTEICQIRG